MTPPDEASTELLRRLRDAIRGEVRFDRLTRQLYSTDASHYRIVPLGVVVFDNLKEPHLAEL